MTGRSSTPARPSYLELKTANLFRPEYEMQCSLCYSFITPGLQAIRCSCGNIAHLACGIRDGSCPECGADFQKLMDRGSEAAILRSVGDSGGSEAVESAEEVELDEKEDMMKQLLKKVAAKEITIEEYKLLASDLKGTFE